MVAWVKWQAVVGALVGTGLAPGWAAACGGGGVTTTSTGVVADAQRIVLALHDQGTPDVTTDIVVQVGVPAAGASYGVLIPVPGEPVIDPEPISIRDLDALDRATAPTIVADSPSESGGGCGCIAAGSAGDTVSSGSSVSVSAPINVGPATVVVLKSDDGTALTDWLDENGFAIPSEHQALVDGYVADGHQFIAVRRSDTAPSAGPSSLGLHYTLRGDHRQLSLAFARLGAAPSVAITVFIASASWVGPDFDFRLLTLDSLDPTLLRQSYSRAVASAVEEFGPHAFVIESTLWYAEGLSDGFAALLGIGGPTHNLLTRASTIVAAEALDTDVRFDSAIGEQPHRRFLDVGEGARAASAGLLAFVALARALRRRWRRASASARALRRAVDDFDVVADGRRHVAHAHGVGRTRLHLPARRLDVDGVA